MWKMFAFCLQSLTKGFPVLRAALWASPAVCSSLIPAQTPALIPQWTRFEHQFESSALYTNPVQQMDLRVAFQSPSGVIRTAYAYWDGDRTWRVRFAPEETGVWTWRSFSDPKDDGLHGVTGSFGCSSPRTNGGRFDRHGPVVIANDGVHLVHADGTPFFWLGDTAWNGPLWSSAEDWDFYIKHRIAQGFTAVQWVASQWRGAPEGDAYQRRAYSGADRIAINLGFFKRLEERHDALRRAGILSVPIMLWAINRGPEDAVNPGVSLPEKDAILLGRYLVARWNADPVVWVLNGDGDYQKEKAARWRNIGRGVFQEIWHAPVAIHPGGLQWVMDGFPDESWLSIAGYQSGHADTDANCRWITMGPPATYWKRDRARALLSLEAPYESPSREGLSPSHDYVTRRNHYWSILNAPIVGVTYGASGVWSWSDGLNPVPGHGARVPPAWKTMLDLPAATQMRYLIQFFESLDFQRLRPEPQVLARQPGTEAMARFISATQTPDKTLTVLYTPMDRTVSVNTAALLPSVAGEWFNPRTGMRCLATGKSAGDTLEFSTPEDGDWLLVLKK
jgi:hypothetical protein